MKWFVLSTLTDSRNRVFARIQTRVAELASDDALLFAAQDVSAGQDVIHGLHAWSRPLAAQLRSGAMRRRLSAPEPQVSGRHEGDDRSSGHFKLCMSNQSTFNKFSLDRSSIDWWLVLLEIGHNLWRGVWGLRSSATSSAAVSARWLSRAAIRSSGSPRTGVRASAPTCRWRPPVPSTTWCGPTKSANAFVRPQLRGSALRERSLTNRPAGNH